MRNDVLNILLPLNKEPGLVPVFPVFQVSLKLNQNSIKKN